jgi:hypothetical protein
LLFFAIYFNKKHTDAPLMSRKACAVRVFDFEIFGTNDAVRFLKVSVIILLRLYLSVFWNSNRNNNRIGDK